MAQEPGTAPFQSPPQMEPINKPRPALAKQSGKGDDTALLNFVDAELKDILNVIGEITGENFIIAPGVSAKITVQTTKPVNKRDVFGIFESILEVNGLAAVRTGQYYKIVSAPTAKQRGVEVRGEARLEEVPFRDSLITQVMPMEFISSKDIVTVLQPLISPAGNIFNYSGGNTLIITDISSNINKLLDIIGLLDVDAFKRMEISLVPVEAVKIEILHKELSNVLTAMGIGKDAGQLSVVPIERLNSLVVFSASGELLESVREWVDRLDQPTSGGVSTHIYYVQDEKASNIKTVLEQTHDITEASNVKIHLYEEANALIVRASKADYQQIFQTIKELDRFPKQVLIDALVAEVTLDESTKHGIQWSVLTGNVNLQQNTGITSATIDNPRGAVSTPIGVSAPSGLSVFATDASRFFGVIQALASDGKVKVLSNPHILVRNFEKASITIGSDEPIATQSTQSAVTGTASLIQNIEYRKTGIILAVTPQITEGGTVAMTIRQEISDISTSRVVGEGTFPSFTKRETETSVVTKDKETIAIGGLIEEKNDKSTTGIPILSKIPFLGNLFKFTTIDNSKTELVILLTPTVVSNSGQAAAVNSEFRNKLDSLKELLDRRY